MIRRGIARYGRYYSSSIPKEDTFLPGGSMESCLFTMCPLSSGNSPRCLFGSRGVYARSCFFALIVPGEQIWQNSPVPTQYVILCFLHVLKFGLPHEGQSSFFGIISASHLAHIILSFSFCSKNDILSP